MENEFNKAAWAQQKQAERDTVFATLDSAASRMGSDPNALRQYLDVQSRFMKMSANNAILITAQRPEATQLASFDTWKEQGAKITAGEKGIAIFEQGAAFTREDGSEGHYTNVTKVFDISQTDAKPAPEEPHPDVQTLIKSLTANSPVRIEVSDKVPEGRTAVYKPEAKAIFVKEGASGPTLFAELSRALATQSLCRNGSTPKDNGLAAFAASYMLCKKNGIDTRGFALDKLSGALGSMDAKGIRAELTKARNAAESVNYQMDKTLHPQQRSEKAAGAR